MPPLPDPLVLNGIFTDVTQPPRRDAAAEGLSLSTPPSLAEQQLAEAARRALRAPAGRTALVLRMSSLTPPAPRPHHRRIARAVLDDVAAQNEGQVFALSNGDLVLLCRSGGGVPGRATPTPATLPDVLARLFRIDAPDPSKLVRHWRLDRAGEEFAAWCGAQVAQAGPAPLPAPEAAAQPSAVEAVDLIVASSRLSDLVQRQMAVLLVPGAGGAGRLQPLYREVTFNVAALEGRLSTVGRASADPYLFRHLAARLDGRMLDALGDDLQRDGPLTYGARDLAGPALHLNLTLAGVLSPKFARFAEGCRRAEARVSVELQLMEACAGPASFAQARDVLRAAGMGVVLDGVTDLALQLTTPAVLQPDLVKLDWSPRLLTADAQLGEVLASIGPSRIVLHRAETEAALAWGLAHGIRRFQGRHVDAMLGAARLQACPYAGGCTLRQCTERASATGPAGRVGCLDQNLLDQGIPQGVPKGAQRLVSNAPALPAASQAVAGLLAAASPHGQ